MLSFGAAFTIRSTSESPVSNTLSQATEGSTLGTKQNPHVVSLTKDQEEPIDLLINVGDYVQFNSKDGSQHQIIQGKPTADHGHDAYADAVHGEEHGKTNSPLDSGIMQADEGYLLQFKNIGKFEFHDNYNHHYAVTVIVYDKDKKIEATVVQ